MGPAQSVSYYPVFLSLKDKSCVIVGGGNVAVRKAVRLIECGANVTVVDRQLVPEMAALVAKGSARHVDDDYKKSHIEGAFLIIGATDRDEINNLIAQDARALNILVNIVDDPKRCDFILPSVLSRGSLAIAISTGGDSPALARKIRQELEDRFGPEYGYLLDIMGRLRELVLADGRPSAENKAVFEAVLQSDILTAIREKDLSRIHSIIKEKTGKDIPLDASWT
jgi:precorrin-2 dehydrogenase/sirohydrochlorin ferrochelatase